MLAANRFYSHDPIGSLQHELNILAEGYQEYLEQESINSEVQCLRNWIDATHRGHLSAMRDLEEFGPELLGHIKDKLNIAATEITRLEGESPIAKNFTGGRVDRLNKAAAIAALACEFLNEALPHQFKAKQTH